MGTTYDTVNATIMAVHKGHEELVRYFISNGVDIDSMGELRSTEEWTLSHSLQAACVAGREQTAKLLLDHGAEVNITGGLYGSTLNAACNSGNLTIVRLLLARGADPRICRGWYGGAFATAILFHSDDIAKALVQAQRKKGGDLKDMLEIGKDKPNWKWIFDGAEETIKDVLEDEEELEVWSESEIVVEDEGEEDEWEDEDNDDEEEEEEEEEEEDDGNGDDTETGGDGEDGDESNEESLAPSKADSGGVLEGLHQKGEDEKKKGKRDNGLDFSWLKVEGIIDSD